MFWISYKCLSPQPPLFLRVPSILNFSKLPCKWHWFIWEEIKISVFVACFFPWQNLWDRDLELKVGTMANFYLSDISNDISTGGGRAAVCGSLNLPLLMWNHSLKSQCSSLLSIMFPRQNLHSISGGWVARWSFISQSHLLWNLVLATGSWRQNEKCWYPKSLNNSVFFCLFVLLCF